MNPFNLEHYQSRHNQVLEKMINDLELPAPRIQEAIQYCLFPGGKRLRPMLVYLCGEILNINIECLDIIAAAIELTHAYSLVHDDLPAMDNDDMRRGKPSCHRAFDEATAILVGDALQAMAIDILLTELPKYLSAEQVIKITHDLIKATGPAGMISGQSLDLTAMNSPDTSEAVLYKIHGLKTGKLISTAINMVLLAGQPTAIEVECLQSFAEQLGIAFQIQDDYLDKYCPSLIGKHRSSDDANEKTTFATLYSQEDLKKQIENYFYKTIISLNPLQQAGMPFIDFLNLLKRID